MYTTSPQSKGHYRTMTNNIHQWTLREMNEDGIPSFEQRTISYNWHKLKRPYETPVLGEHFAFSYGKLLRDVTLSEDIKYLNDFDWLQ